METIYEKIKIIPLKKILIHEGIIRKWAENIANRINDEGIVKNPVVVARKGNCYLALDGAHRLEAMRILGCRDILAYVVDYYNPEIKLEGWDGLIFEKIALKALLQKLFPGKGLLIKKHRKGEKLRKKVLDRKLFFVLESKGGDVCSLSSRKDLSPEKLLDLSILCIEKLEQYLDEKRIKILYVPNTASRGDFRDSDARILITRPHFHKDEVVKRTLEKKIFPRKSTRHLIPQRPLGINLNLSLLKEDIDLKIKNKLLASHLEWCWKSNHVRSYPESVFIFSD